MNMPALKSRVAKARHYRPRLLPTLLASGTALLGLKVVAVWQGTEEFLVALGTPAQAEEQAATPAKPGAQPSTPAAQGGHTPGNGAGGSAPAAQTPATRPADPDFAEGSTPSASEMQVLQSLAKRREELVGRERQLEMQATMLKAAEQRVDQKIARLTTLEGEIQKLLRQNDEAEEARLRSLVKVYEAMKPKDAARIFENLDQDVLLDVAERMKEAKIAPILASMEPAAAQAVTVKLATRRKLPEEAPPLASPASKG